MNDIGRAAVRLLLRLMLVLLATLVLWAMGPWLWRLFSPFLIAVPVALLLRRPIRFTEKHLRVAHGAAVAAWVLVVCAVLCLAVYWLLATVIGQVVQLSTNSQQIIGDAISMLRDAIGRFFDSLNYMPETVETWIRGAFNDALAALSAMATRWASALLSFAVSFASSLPYALIYLNFLVLGIFFITSSFERNAGRVQGLMGESMRERSALLSDTAGHGVSGYVKVQALYAALVLAVSWPCLSLFRIPYPFLVALLASLLEFLPIFGNGTLYIPWAVVAYVIGAPAMALKMLLLHLGLFLFRRLTEPKLMSNQMGLSPLLSLIAMFVGMQLGGVLGLILAPVGVVMVQGAWAGGIFSATAEDLLRIVRYVSSALRDRGDTPETANRVDANAPTGAGAEAKASDDGPANRPPPSA